MGPRLTEDCGVRREIIRLNPKRYNMDEARTVWKLLGKMELISSKEQSCIWRDSKNASVGGNELD